MTATSPWIYNQVGANLTGVLVVLLGLGLWRALSPDVIGRIGVAVLIAEGTSTFFDGIFHSIAKESMRRATTSRGTHAALS